MAFGRLIEPEARRTDHLYRLVDEVEHRLRRPIRAAQPQVLQFTRAHSVTKLRRVARGLGHLARELVLGDSEVLRARALEAEDRLLVIAHHEDRAQLVVALPQSREEIFGKRSDDLPLRLIGVLRLVDEDMIDAPVELVADPFAEPPLAQKACSAADQIVEIDQPLALLRRVPGQGEAPADGERRGQQVDQFEQRPLLPDGFETGPHALRHARIVGVELLERLQRPHFALLREQRRGEFVAAFHPGRRIARQPGFDRFDAFRRRRSAPGPVHVEAADQRRAVEHRVVAECGDGLGSGIGRKPEQLLHPVLQRLLPSADAEPRLARFGTAHQPGARLVRPHAKGEPFQRGDGFNVPVGLPLDQEVGEDAVRQHLAVAVLHRLGAGDEASLFGKRSEQPLGEGVNRIDPEAAARAIEHAGEQRARAGAGIRIGRRADVEQIAFEQRVGKAYPARQYAVHTLRHLGGAGFRKRQAQDVFRLHAGRQQQSQNPRRKHLGLASPRRRGEPDAVRRVDGTRLIVHQGMNLAHSSCPSHSSSRMSWSNVA